MFWGPVVGAYQGRDQGSRSPDGKGGRDGHGMKKTVEGPSSSPPSAAAIHSYSLGERGEVGTT